LAAVLGIGGLALLLCCGGFVWFVSSTPQASAAARQPWNVAAVPVPPFPERGQSTMLVEEVNIQTYAIKLGPSGGFYNPPGHGGAMYLYLPPGQHAVGSLPCVLFTGAGTDLLQGYEFLDGLRESEDEKEVLPYAQAGIAVLAYELDGPAWERSEADAYRAFRSSCAGLVNARNALEFVLARVPEVNPRQIYAAGHSSAGTMALLFAEHEPRLAGCVAYAPCSDVQDFVSEDMPGFVLRLRAMEMPGLTDFIVQSSPRTHESRLNCPLFLFHADDDSNVPASESRNFAARLKALGKDVTHKTVPSGDHYDSMLQEGIPAGIEWIKARAGQR
jgi:dienelactone hydrolase